MGLPIFYQYFNGHLIENNIRVKWFNANDLLQQLAPPQERTTTDEVLKSIR
ncbi:MAG: hypothetical protein L3J53_08150 [Proteobacteria bacterium]|nr:hypothetical protein [Pseudomonadota bacterium]